MSRLRAQHHTDREYSKNLSMLMARNDEKLAARLRGTALWTVALHGAEALPTRPWADTPKKAD